MRIERATKRAGVIGAALFSLFVLGTMLPSTVRPGEEEAKFRDGQKAELAQKTAELQRLKQDQDQINGLLRLGRSGEYFLVDVIIGGNSLVIRKEKLFLFQLLNLTMRPEEYVARNALEEFGSKEWNEKLFRKYAEKNDNHVRDLEGRLREVQARIPSLTLRIAELEELIRWPQAEKPSGAGPGYSKARDELLEALKRRREIKELLLVAEAGYFLIDQGEDGRNIKPMTKQDVIKMLFGAYFKYLHREETDLNDVFETSSDVAADEKEALREAQDETRQNVQKLKDELLQLEPRMDSLSAKMAEAQRPPQQQTSPPQKSEPPPPQQAGGQTDSGQKDLKRHAGFWRMKNDYPKVVPYDNAETKAGLEDCDISVTANSISGQINISNAKCRGGHHWSFEIKMTGHDKGILNPGDRLIVSLEGTATEPSPRFGPNVSVSLHKSVTFNIINVEPLPEGYGMAQSMDIRLDSYTRQLTAKRTITLEVPPPADMRTDKLVLSLTIHVSSHCCMLCTQGFSWGEIVCEWEPMHGGFR